MSTEIHEINFFFITFIMIIQNKIRKIEQLDSSHRF